MNPKIFKITLKTSDIIMEQGETWVTTISAQFTFEYIEAMWRKITTPFLTKTTFYLRRSMAFVKSTLHSTLFLILLTLYKTTWISLKLFTCGIFIDLKKAFDTVDHAILLQKLDHYGIRGIINDWFSSYLVSRSQVTEVDTYLSSKSQISYGVPQGSALGPLLFLIYINDIHNSSDKLSFFLFADDTNLLYADKNLKSLEETVNNELLKVSEWLNANKLTLNAKKSNYVIFRPYQRICGLFGKYQNV